MLSPDPVLSDPAAPAGEDRVREAAAQVASELAESLGDVVYAFRIHPDYAFEYISPGVEALTGYSDAEYYANPGIAVENTPEEHRQAIEEAYLADPGVVSDFTVQWRHRDGGFIWTHHRCVKEIRADGSVVILSAARDVTAQVDAERALAESRQMYRLLAENASDMVWRTNLEAVVEWVSPSVTTVMGWTPAEMIGNRILDQVHPDDIERVRNATIVANEGGRVSFEARYLCKDEVYRWLEVTARPLMDADGNVIGKAGSCRDVHSEIEAWHALERSERRFRLAMESAPTGMAVLDLDGRFIEVNTELCRMLGQDQTWLLDHQLSDVLHPADDNVVLRLQEEVLSGRVPSATEELRMLRRDHAVVWAQAAIGLLRDDDGIPLSLVTQFVNVTDAHEAREALRFMATHDALTGLLNRRELLVRMSMVLAHARRGVTRMAVLFADLDGLKEVNDTLGHSAGDQLLIEAGRRIEAQVRDGDLTARLGGDEFVVVLPEVRDLDDAMAVADKISQAIAKPLYIAGTEVPLGISIGVTVARTGDDATTLLRNADAALYRAKAGGRARIEVYDPALDG